MACDDPEAFTSTRNLQKWGGENSSKRHEPYIVQTNFELPYQ